MIITRKVARWALLLKREALGRNYGAQKRSEEAPSGATAMLPRSGRVDDNIDTDTVATDLDRISSCVALALPLPFPYYYHYYYNPRAGIASQSLFEIARRTLRGDHEDELPIPVEGIDGPRGKATCTKLAASTEPKTKEQQDVEHGGQETENAARGIEKGITVFASVDSNRLNYQNVRARFSA
ncbi:uncharacterized protein LOC143264449 [Megachile rotundata]|uniref:uncharacterized protein LOC143264449 n=1 Tax=Megachile rotundata TaxID=143995 RepID=UPI003FD61279